jgi:hypothetical protein
LKEKKFQEQEDLGYDMTLTAQKTNDMKRMAQKTNETT